MYLTAILITTTGNMLRHTKGPAPGTGIVRGRKQSRGQDPGLKPAKDRSGPGRGLRPARGREKMTRLPRRPQGQGLVPRPTIVAGRGSQKGTAGRVPVPEVLI